MSDSKRDDLDRTIAPLRGDARSHPYLVIRWVAAVYGTAEIRIASSDGVDTLENGISIVDASYRAGDVIEGPLRRKIIDAALARSRVLKHKMCIVFAANDCVYVEPDGRFSGSSVPPSGGIRFDKAIVSNNPM
jgi:hypothetical protein